MRNARKSSLSTFAVLVVVVLGMATIAHAAPLIVNNSFESPVQGPGGLTLPAQNVSLS
jgi:hypothetical protein